MNPASPERTTDGRYCKGSGRAPVHGHSSGGKCTPEYYSWVNAKTRCNNPNYKDWKHYGKRGIKICEHWDTFENFIADIGPMPGPKYTLERKNNELGYSCGHCPQCLANGWPMNCRWATRLEQAQNKRNNHIVEFQGQFKTIRAWSRELGIPYGRLVSRLRMGWDPAKALTAPKVAPRLTVRRKGSIFVPVPY